MGSPEGDDDEQPVHNVALDGSWIDRAEVTNAQYGQCVAAVACHSRASSGSDTRDLHDGNDAYDDYPMTYVT